MKILLKYSLLLTLCFVIENANAQIDTLRALLDKQSKTEHIINVLNHHKLHDSLKLQFYNQAQELVASNTNLLAYVLSQKAIYFFRVGDNDTAIANHNKVISLLRQKKPSVLLAKSYGGIANAWRRKGNLEQKIQYLDSAITIANALNFSDEIQFSLPLDKANTMLRLGNETAFLETYKNSIQLLSETNYKNIKIGAIRNLAAYYTNKANASQDQKIQYLNKAIDYYKMGLKDKDALDCREASILKMNMATALSLYPKPRKQDIANYLSEAQACFKSVGDTYNTTLLGFQKGVIYKNYKGYNQSIQYFESLISNTKTNNYPEVRLRGLEMLYQTYKDKKDYKNAFNYYEIANHLKDSIESAEIKNKIISIEKNFRIQQKENQIQRLKQEQALSKSQQNTIIIASVSIMVVVLLFGWFYWKRHQIKLAFNKEQLLRLKTEMTAKKLQEENLKNKLELKANQLLSKSIQLTERKAFNSNLLELINHANTDAKKKLKQLKTILQRDLNQSSILKEFQTFFESHHLEFLSDLKTKHPNLTQNELRLASFIKIGLSNKEMANILHVETNTIKVARYRLKKKLQRHSEK